MESGGDSEGRAYVVRSSARWIECRHLTRAVEIRENMLRQEAGEPGIAVGIQLRLNGDLCAVYSSDLLRDLVPEHPKDIVFVAIRKGGKGVVSAAPAPAAPDPVAAPAAPAPAGGKVVAPLDATPGKPSTSNHQQHSDQLSVTTPAGQQDTAGAGYGGARATASPAAPAGAAATAGTSPALVLPSAPFRPPESCTSLGSSSRPSAPLKTSSAPSPAPFASKPAAVTATSAVYYDGVEYMTQDGSDDEDDVVCLGVSDRGGSSGVAFSPRPSKRTRKAGKDPQLLPRSAIESQQQAAATIVLAAAMLRGGTPTQQSQAEAFVASELAKHDKDLTGHLVESLKSTVEVNEDGIWVGLKRAVGLCGTHQSDKGFFCLTRYMFSDSHPAPSIHARQPYVVLQSAYGHVAGDKGSGSLLERWQIDNDRVFKWRDDVVCLGGSDGGGAAASSGPPRKKARVTGSPSQLQPRSALTTRVQATETLILAAAMLRGGTSSQQKEAEAFVEAKLAKHNKQRSARFIKGLKSAVKMDGDGVLVGRLDLVNLCRTHGFYGVTRYLVGDQIPKKSSGPWVYDCFLYVQQAVMSKGGGRFEMWEKDGKDVFKWLDAQD